METAAAAMLTDASPHINHTSRTVTSGCLDGLPDPAARFLHHTIAAGVPLPERVCIAMHGQIKVMGIWLPFRADEIIDRRAGFTWHARVAGGLLRVRDVYDLELGHTRVAVGAVPHRRRGRTGYHPQRARALHRRSIGMASGQPAAGRRYALVGR